jgi:hypothetical protein
LSIRVNVFLRALQWFFFPSLDPISPEDFADIASLRDGGIAGSTNFYFDGTKTVVTDSIVADHRYFRLRRSN